VQSALRAAGLSPGVVEQAAMDLLVQAAGGIVRSLCLLAQASWIAAASQGAQTIGPVHVQSAIDEVPYSPGLFQAPLAQEASS
jgi:hypothetical protein